MQADSQLPFPIGSTAGVTGSTDLGWLEGQIYEIQDLDKTTSPGKPRANASANQRPTKKVMVVRNVSGIALGPRRLVTFKSGFYGKQVDGYSCTTAVSDAYPVDEFVSSVPNNDLFYIVIEGPAEFLTDLAAGANNVLPADTVFVALTAVTSQSTTAGRVAPQDFVTSITGTSSGGALLAAQLAGAIGKGISAKTTANTNVAVLGYVFRKNL